MCLGNQHIMTNSAEPFWVCPCGQSSNTTENVQQTPKKDLIDNIIKVTKISQNVVNNVKQDFFKAIFGDVAYDESMFNDTLYDWLSSRDDIPKKLGETLPDKYLQTITFDTVLPLVYTNLQTIAAGVETKPTASSKIL